MTAPAARLLAAADLLDKRASEATEGPWVVWPGPDRSLVCTTVEHCTCGGGLEGYGHEPGCGLEEPPGVQASDEDARYIALMHPEVGKALAKVLRAEAKRLKRTERLLAFGGAPLFKPEPDTLALADLLLAGAP